MSAPGLDDPPGYPEAWVSDIVTADGRTVHVRPIRPADAEAIRRLHARCSAETIYYRFFTPLPVLSDQLLEHFVVVDYEDRMAFVAEWENEIIAVARYDRLADAADAEVAFLVDDAHQGKGLGAALLELLAAYARHHGIGRFVAETLPDNIRMLKVFQDAGYQIDQHWAEGTVRVVFPIEPTPQSVAAMAERERRAAVRQMAALLHPGSVALVGASRTPGSVGDVLLANLLAARYEGTIWVVHPEARALRGVRTISSLRKAEAPVDLAIVAVPAEALPGVLEDAHAVGVRALVVLTAGFSETSPERLREERALVAAARRLGMRVVGPNSMGVAVPPIGLNATLAPFELARGHVAVHAQSGPLSLAILATLLEGSLGIASFVSSGNKADVSGNDLLAWWEGDEQVRVIVLYIEDFGNPRTFARVARRVSRAKPILVVKPTRPQGRRLRAVRDGQLDAEEAIDALLAHTGVVRAETLGDLLDVARLLEAQPLPGGGRVAVLANTQGAAPLVADALARAGLELADLTPSTLAQLRARGVDAARLTNPLELGPAIVPEEWGAAVDLLLADDGVDAVVISFIPTVVGEPGHPRLLANPLPGGSLRGAPAHSLARAGAVADAVARAAAQRQRLGATKPVLANFLALPGVPEALQAGPRPLPSYVLPEAAARALGHAVRYAQWRQRPLGEPLPRPAIDAAGVARAITTPVSDPTQLDQEHAEALAAALGIPTSPPVTAGNSTSSERIVELCLELLHHARYGAYLRISLATAPLRQLGATVLAAVPETDLDVVELLTAVPGLEPELLDATPVDELTTILAALTWLAEHHPEVASVVATPVVGAPQGWWIEHATVWLRPWHPDPALLTRSLRAPGPPPGRTGPAERALRERS